MPTKYYSGFKGIDRTDLRLRKDPESFFDSLNMQLTTKGLWETRPGYQHRATVHPQAKGLYVANGVLRCAVPAGSKYYKQFEITGSVEFDPIGKSESEDLADDYIADVHDTNTFLTNGNGDRQPYLLITNPSGGIEHHWAQYDSITTDQVNTKVQTSFQGGKSLAKLDQRFFTIDTANLTVPYSATLKADDWLTPDDAGFVNVSEHASGGRNLGAVSFLRDNLVVFFEDSVQLWDVATDPDRDFFLQAMNGPSTKAFRSIANVDRDIYFLSTGGFRSVSSLTVQGERAVDDIGELIQPLTDLEDAEGDPIALWSDATSRYYCVFNQPDNTSVWYVYTKSIVNNVSGWSRWTMDKTVEYLVENDGVISFRTGDDIYDLIEGQGNDEGTPINYQLQTHGIFGEDVDANKNWLDMELSQSSECQVGFILQASDTEADGFQRVVGDTVDSYPVDITWTSPQIAVVIKGTGHNKIEAFGLTWERIAGGNR